MQVLHGVHPLWIPEIPEMVMKICGDLRCGMMWTESLTGHVRYGWCTLNWEPLAD